MKVIIFPILTVIFSFCQNTAFENHKNVERDDRILTETVQVEFCELLDRANAFDGREVQTVAILMVGFESAFLYDPRCLTNDKLVWFEVESDLVNEQLGIYMRPDTFEFRTVGVNRVNGKFLGTFQTKKEKGFGHMNSSSYRFNIKDAIGLSYVSNDVPYPW